MNAADFNELSEVEKTHFYKCEHCGEMVDKRGKTGICLIPGGDPSRSRISPKESCLKEAALP